MKYAILGTYEKAGAKDGIFWRKRELVVGENKLQRSIRITFKLRFMDKINTVTRYSF